MSAATGRGLARKGVGARGEWARRAHRRRRRVLHRLTSDTLAFLRELADLAPPVLIGMAVDTVVERESSLLASFGFVAAETQLTVLAVLTVVVWGTESVFEYLYARAWRTLAQTIQHELRLQRDELADADARSRRRPIGS